MKDGLLRSKLDVLTCFGTDPLLCARSVASGNGLYTHYFEAGEGPALVLLHGLFSHGLCWLPTVKRLSRRYRVIVPDMLGHGCSSLPRTPYGRMEYRRWLYGFTKALGLDGFHLCGHSLGCTVAVEHSLAYPSCIQSLSLVNPLALLWPVPLVAQLKASIAVLQLVSRSFPFGREHALGQWQGMVFDPGRWPHEPYALPLSDYSLQALQQPEGPGLSGSASPMHCVPSAGGNLAG